MGSRIVGRHRLLLGHIISIGIEIRERVGCVRSHLKRRLVGAPVIHLDVSEHPTVPIDPRPWIPDKRDFCVGRRPSSQLCAETTANDDEYEL